MAKKKKVVKAWCWQGKESGELAYTRGTNGFVTLHTADTRKYARTQGVYSEHWKLVRVTITID